MDLSSYPGRKKTLFQWIVNRIPPHKCYFELFCGSAYIALNKKPAPLRNVINDISPNLIAVLDYDGSNQQKISMSAMDIIQSDVIPADKDSFVYLDPPYPIEARKSQKRLYKFEMSMDDHQKLLMSILPAKFNCMISTNDNQLYRSMLQSWNCEQITMQTRGGPTKELIYYNYEKPTILHQYDYLGENFTERQRIKRKIYRHAKRLMSMPVAERNAIVDLIVKSFYPEP